MSWYGDWRPYVPAAQKRAQAAGYAAQMAKKAGRETAPIEIVGGKIAKSFWGKAWCDNLEGYSDFANRLPRGRTYVRNGSVVDLTIEPGEVQAIVGGSEPYRVAIKISPLAPVLWRKIKADCTQSIGSLMDLLQGRFDEGVMRRLTDRKAGMFPQPKEISIECSCPDYAQLCKHAAATLYGIGSRLDTEPELLFTLREVDHLELVQQAVTAENLQQTLGSAGALGDSDLGEIFGIDLVTSADSGQRRNAASTPAGRSARSRTKPAAARAGGTQQRRRKSPPGSPLGPEALEAAREMVAAVGSMQAAKEALRELARLI